MEVYTFRFNAYKFSVELDTGAEVGEYQLTVYYCEKQAVQTVPLTHFKIQVLLSALKEPYKSLLNAQLQESKWLHKQIFEGEIATIKRPYLHVDADNDDKQHHHQGLPKKVKKHIRQLRKQLNEQLHTLDNEFLKRELLSLAREHFDEEQLRKGHAQYGDWHVLRTFYFEEANYDNIRTFCQEFAEIPAYRQEILAGQRRWTRRNALFYRNLPSMTQMAYAGEKDKYIQNARELFHWLNIHTDEILALPAYQELQRVDSAFQPSPHEIDPHIRPAIALLNSIPGIRTRFSCQGVSGKVQYQQRTLLAVTPHDEYGYVAFEKLSPLAHDVMVRELAQYPHMTTQPTYLAGPLHFVLRSTSDNKRFCEELYSLAQRLHELLPQNGKQESEETITHWMQYGYPARFCPTPNPAGIVPSRLRWLCQQEQIEQTLYLLHHLRYWLHNNTELPYEEINKLQHIKTTLIAQAYHEGTIKPSAYMSGLASFAQDYHIVDAAFLAAETCCEWMEEEDNAFRSYKQQAQVLCARITGQSIEMGQRSLTVNEIERYITQQLLTLIRQARQRRQPIPTTELQALFISPQDLLPWDDLEFSVDWDNLHERQLQCLDPEGLSVVAFTYKQQDTLYTFHIPFREAEKFLLPSCLQELRHRRTSSEECGIRHGQDILSKESLAYPIANILHELASNIHAIEMGQTAQSEHGKIIRFPQVSL